MTIPSWARVGASVVCIKGGSPLCNGFRRTGQFPVTGGIYKISRAFNGRTINGDGWFVELEGIPSYANSGWNGDRFRPSVSPKTEAQDLAKFSHLLNAKVDA